MSLPKKEVEKIAHLARISLNEPDISLDTRHLSDILNLVE
ncbi:MAG: Asp-tRNA(Asn)/Glu-tRNA(Gln) amidotransferase GatCAB subunit C, partial [Gammaproteobacteria bacterium]